MLHERASGVALSQAVVLPWGQGSFAPRGDLVMSGDTVGCYIWEKGLLLASSDYRPGMLLNILRCARQPSITKNDLTQNSTAKVEKPWSNAT